MEADPSPLPPVPKRRCLRLAAGDGEALARLRASLGALEGVLEFNLDASKLHLLYDLRRLDLVRIEALVAAEGLTLGGGLHALRRAMWRFAEHNERQTLTRPASPCCSRPPPGAR